MFLPMIFLSCGIIQKTPDNKENYTNEIIAESQHYVRTDSLDYLISKTSFMGISLGDKISENSDILQKGVYKCGEGDFDVYYIINENGEQIGHIYPENENEPTVDNITISSPLAYTKEGIRIGSCYKDICKVLTGFEVHGSEIESRTHVSDGNFRYRLDIYFNTYDVDSDEIPEETKIIEIYISE